MIETPKNDSLKQIDATILVELVCQAIKLPPRKSSSATIIRVIHHIIYICVNKKRLK